MPSQKSIVITVAGPSGSGKTTLVKRLAERLPAKALYFDDYREIFVGGGDFVSWLRHGGDPACITKPGLVEALADLDSGYMVIEEPFGRSRPDLAPYVDVSVVIDLPLGVAMARRRARTLAVYYGDSSPEEIAAYEKKDDQWLQDFGLGLYRRVQELALSSADVLVDGQLASEEMAAQVLRVVLNGCPPNLGAGS